MLDRGLRIFGYAATICLVTPMQGFAEVEHVTLQQPCNGKTGRAIAQYFWFTGQSTERVNIFTDLCLDLDAMRIFGAENSDELIPAYQAPGQMTYYSYPIEGSDRHRETVTLHTIIQFDHEIEFDDDLDQLEHLRQKMENLPSPEAPGVPTSIEWVKSSNARPLDWVENATVWLHGFAGEVPPENTPTPGEYHGYGMIRLNTRERDARLAGVGFSIEAELAVTEGDAEVVLWHHDDGGARRRAFGPLTLDFHDDEVSGQGHFQADHLIETRDSDSVWKNVDLEVAGLTGKLTGEDADRIYVLVIWDGTYTDFAGNSYPADAVMSFSAFRQD